MKEFNPSKEICISIIPSLLLFLFCFSILIYGGFWLGRNKVMNDVNSVDNEFKALYRAYHQVNIELFFMQSKPENDLHFHENSKSFQVTLLKKKVNSLAMEYNALSKRYDPAILIRDSLPSQLKLYHFKNFNY